MANDKENIDINAQVKKGKKKVMIVMGILVVICLSIAGFFGYKYMSASKAEKQAIEAELNALDIKDYPVEDIQEGEENAIYTRDITKETYLLKNGAIRFEATLVFHNRLCANLYSGVTDKELQISTVPDLTVETSFIGDKLAKNALNKYLQDTVKSEVSSSTDLAVGLAKNINKEFVDKFGYEVIKEVLITSHVVQ